MNLIVGLGNPGKEYERTRHNIAWIIFDIILNKVDWKKDSKGQLFYYKEIKGEKEITYIKPQTFMNNSGLSVSAQQKKYKLKSENIIVLHDDIDLPFGQIRISFDRGDGGHNGIKSIMNHLHSQSFIRVRVGVSILDENNILHKPEVLSNFSKIDLEIIKQKISPKISKILEMLVTKSKEEAMNKFNTN